MQECILEECRRSSIHSSNFNRRESVPVSMNILGGHHSLYGQFGEEKNNLTVLGFEHCIIPLVTESRYRLRYPCSDFQLDVKFHVNGLLLS